MTDLGNFEVESRELRGESGEWETRRAALEAAKGLADNGVGKGYNMGFFANLAGLDDYHDQFISAMVTAFSDGVATFDFIGASLASAADAYDGADDTASASAADLKKRLPQ